MKNSRKITDIPQKITVLVAFCIYALLLYFLKIPCVIFKITGVECIGCGMTRALVSALHLDFASAFSRHFMFWSVPLLFLSFLLDGKLFKSKSGNCVFYILIGLGFLINWLYHIML